MKLGHVEVMTGVDPHNERVLSQKYRQKSVAGKLTLWRGEDRRVRRPRDDHEGERACGGHGVAQGGLGYGDSYQVGDESAGRRQRRHDHALDDERMSRFGELQIFH